MMPNFKKELKKAKHFYFNVWRGNEKPSPAFNGEIVKVTREGWNHTIFSLKRKKIEILLRLQILRIAKYLIENSDQYSEYRKVGDSEYWALEGSVNKKRIRVIIRSKNKGPKHFFSVFQVE